MEQKMMKLLRNVDGLNVDAVERNRKPIERVNLSIDVMKRSK